MRSSRPRVGNVDFNNTCSMLNSKRETGKQPGIVNCMDITINGLTTVHRQECYAYGRSAKVKVIDGVMLLIKFQYQKL